MVRMYPGLFPLLPIERRVIPGVPHHILELGEDDGLPRCRGHCFLVGEPVALSIRRQVGVVISRRPGGASHYTRSLRCATCSRIQLMIWSVVLS